MDKQLMLLVLDGKEPQNRGLGFRVNRTKAINTISKMGAKVRHDSGERLIVFEASKEEVDALTRQFPGSLILPVNSDLKELPDLNPNELLFLNALKIRISPAYREAKKRRIPGETPEEKLLFSAPCVKQE